MARANKPPRPRNAVRATNKHPGAFGANRSKSRPFATHAKNPPGTKLLRRIAKRVLGLPSRRVTVEHAEEVVIAQARRFPKEPRYPVGDRRNPK